MINWGNGYCGIVYQPSQPNPVYPSNGLLHVPANFTLRWTSGLDATPPDVSHPVNYVIHCKYWPYGAVEPTTYPLPTDPQPCNITPATDLQHCNMDASANCNVPLTGMLDGNYRLYVEVNLSNGQISPATMFGNAAGFTVGYQPIGTIAPPLPPNPVYPYDGLQGVATNFPVRWQDGLTPERRNAGWMWPVTYAIYYKYWPFGGVEPQNYTLVVANQPCNPLLGSVGICDTDVTGEPAGNFRWYVVANMDASLFTGVPNSILHSTSSVATFTVGP